MPRKSVFRGRLLRKRLRLCCVRLPGRRLIRLWQRWLDLGCGFELGATQHRVHRDLLGVREAEPRHWDVDLCARRGRDDRPRSVQQAGAAPIGINLDQLAGFLLLERSFLACQKSAEVGPIETAFSSTRRPEPTA